MKVSVITPSYNSAATIRETILSVARQTHAPVEYIIVDGGSDDNTMSIVEELSDHVDQVVSEADGGIYHAMNKGIRRATGDVVGILNSDDIYHNAQVLEKVVAKFRETGSDAVYGDLNYVDWGDNRVLRRWRSGEFRKARLLRGWMPPHPTFFVRREIYEQHRLFNENLSLAADYELMLRLLYREKISVAYIPEVLVRMKTGGKGNREWRSRWVAFREDYRAWNQNGLNRIAGLGVQVLKRLRKIKQFLPFTKGGA